MQSIRRSVLAITVTLLALVAGSGTALAGPAPLIEPQPGSPSSGSSSSGGFLDSWAQVTLAVLVVVAVVAIAAIGLTRMRHHAPTAA